MKVDLNIPQQNDAEAAAMPRHVATADLARLPKAVGQTGIYRAHRYRQRYAELTDFDFLFDRRDVDNVATGVPRRQWHGPRNQLASAHAANC